MNKFYIIAFLIFILALALFNIPFVDMALIAEGCRNAIESSIPLGSAGLDYQECIRSTLQQEAALQDIRMSAGIVALMIALVLSAIGFAGSDNV